MKLRACWSEHLKISLLAWLRSSSLSNERDASSSNLVALDKEMTIAGEQAPT